jgi:uncharacterized protein (TIRG00374 family)
MRRASWKLVIGIVISAAIIALAYLERDWLLDALSLLQEARPVWLVVAWVTMLGSFLVMSQVFQIALRMQGHRMGILPLWATALVSIVLSQTVPAGGVWSYAFLVNTFKRWGVSSVKSALVATMDVLSYGITMILVVTFGMIYLAFHNLTVEGGSYAAAGIALCVVGLLVFLLTRSEDQLLRWLLTIKNLIERMIGRSWSDENLRRMIAELTHGREMLTNRPRDLLLLIPIQFTSLSGHSLAMLAILVSFGVHTTFLVVLTAFGIALITSTFTVLPGGGGTVETALVAVLLQLGVGHAALPAAILFRLMNFWLMIPIAAACYYWLTNGPSPNGDTHPNQALTDSEH